MTSLSAASACTSLSADTEDLLSERPAASQPQPACSDMPAPSGITSISAASSVTAATLSTCAAPSTGAALSTGAPAPAIAEEDLYEEVYVDEYVEDGAPAQPAA